MDQIDGPWAPVPSPVSRSPLSSGHALSYEATAHFSLLAQPGGTQVGRTARKAPSPRRPSLHPRTGRPCQQLVQLHNRDPKPFVWHKTTVQILDSVARFRTRTLDAGH